MTTGEKFFRRIGKTRFDHLYDLADCAAYYRALAPLDYQTPAHAVPVIRSLLTELTRLRGIDSHWVLDIACGYGIAAALLRYEVDMATVLARYDRPEVSALNGDQILDADRKWYAGRRRSPDSVRMAGLDISLNALRYARRVGLYDLTFSDDLERDDPGTDLASLLPKVQMLVEMGAFGYIGESTFSRLLERTSGPLPWVVTAPTRVADCEPSLRLMESVGLRVERAPIAPFRHRRFTGADEQRHALEELQRKGRDTTGLEQTGFYYSDVYVARPPQETSRSLDSLLGPAP